MAADDADFDQHIARVTDSLAERFADRHDRQVIEHAVARARAELEPSARVTKYLPVLISRRATEQLLRADEPTGSAPRSPSHITPIGDVLTYGWGMQPVGQVDQATRSRSAHVVVRDDISLEALLSLSGCEVTHQPNSFHVVMHLDQPSELYVLLDDLRELGATLIGLSVTRSER